MTSGIDLKALQLTIILLRQYHPELAVLLPSPQQYPLPNTNIDLDLTTQQVADIIHALTQLGEKWLDESMKNPVDKNRNRMRKQCIGYLLEQWIAVGEQFQAPPKQQLH